MGALTPRNRQALLEALDKEEVFEIADRLGISISYRYPAEAIRKIAANNWQMLRVKIKITIDE